jgi:hypothetical protein
MGCDWKNKRGACVGRKEKKLLKELKVEIGTVANDAILAEYGDMYSVQIIVAYSFDSVNNNRKRSR